MPETLAPIRLFPHRAHLPGAARPSRDFTREAPRQATRMFLYSGFGEARRAGIDLDMLDTNLALSVAERWRQHDAALELALKLEQAGKSRNAKLQSASATSR